MVDKEARLVWLRALRRFKQGINTRVRMGVIQSYCEKVFAERRSNTEWQAPVWKHHTWTDLLYTSIRDDEYSPELIIGFVQTAEVTFLAPSTQPTPSAVVSAINATIAQLSVPLRTRFGVFKEK